MCGLPYGGPHEFGQNSFCVPKMGLSFLDLWPTVQFSQKTFFSGGWLMRPQWVGPLPDHPSPPLSVKQSPEHKYHSGFGATAHPAPLIVGSALCIRR